MNNDNNRRRRGLKPCKSIMITHRANMTYNNIYPEHPYVRRFHTETIETTQRQPPVFSHIFKLPFPNYIVLPTVARQQMY